MVQELIELLRRSVFPMGSTDELFNQYAEEEPRVDRAGAATSPESRSQVSGN